MSQANDFIVGIVRLVTGHTGTVTEQHIMQAAKILAQPPNGSDGVGLWMFCQTYLAAYKNQDYDEASNGEQWLLSQLAALHPKVVFDVGANIGGCLTRMLITLPEARFHAFEIMDTTFEALRKNMAGHANVDLNPFGLSDHAGSTKINRFHASGQFSSYVAYPHGDHDEIVCPVQRGDAYMKDKGIERIDFLKLDVEGAEHLVLQGFGDAIGEGRINVIQFEYGRLNIFTHFLLRDFYDFFESKGYVVGKLFPDHVDFRDYQLSDEDFLGSNYLAVRKERPDIIDVLRRPEKS